MYRSVSAWVRPSDSKKVLEQLVHLSPRIDPLEHPHPLEPSSIGCGEIISPALFLNMR